MVTALATASLRRRPLRTALTALGIAVAVAGAVVFLSLGEGLRQVFAQEIGAVGPDLQVSYGPFDAASLTAVPELPLDYLDALRADAERFGIAQATPLLLYARGGFDPSRAFLFQGLPPDTDPATIYAGFEVTAGRALGGADADRRVAVVGQRAAERNRLELGDELRLNPQSRFEIVGLATSSGGLIDNAIVVPLRPLQEAIGIDDRVSFFALDLENPGDATATADAIQGAYPDLGVQTRGDVLSVIEQGIRVTDVVRLGISAIALIVGGIAVANTMLMSVFERTREFGVVRAVGARPRFLFALVLLESVLLSLLGALGGVLLGRLGIVAVNAVARDLIGLEVAVLTLRLTLFAVAVAFATGVLSGLVPAARAARIPIAVAVARE